MKSVSREKTFRISVPVHELFPLFSPEGERSWVPGWDYDNLMGTSTLSDDYVFLTKTHSHGNTEAIWIVKRYLPEDGYVAYYKVEPGEKVGVVEVQCRTLTETESAVKVRYKYIPLSESGNKFVEEFTQDRYDSFISEWKDLLEAYLDGRD